VQRIVHHCLEKAPDDRFQTARDLAFALQAASPTQTGTAPVAAVPGGQSDRWRIAWWWSVVAAASACAAAWIVMHPRETNNGPRFDRVVRLVATDAVESSPVLSPDGKWIAYLSDEGGQMNVWVRSLSGGQSVNLTGSASDLHVSAVREIGGLDISPDGSEIAFTASPDASGPANQLASYVIPAPLGGIPRKLIERGAGVRWSPDGRRIAYVLPGGYAGDSLVVADRTGEHPREVLPVAGGLHAHWVAWSADGQYLYYHRSGTSANLEPTEIYRVPVSGGPEERVIQTSRRAVFACPLSDGLVYSANPSTVDLALFWKPSNGRTVPLTTGMGEYAEARLSSDRQRMVATVYQPQRALWTIAVDEASAQPVMVTRSGFGDSDPAWSPRADRLAFSSTRSGDRNIWTSKPDGTDPRQVTSGHEIDDRPQWSADGTRLAFVSSRGGERGIWTVAADGGAPRRVLAANVLNSVSWSPDGKELVYAAPNGDAPALFRVRVDGGTPVRIHTATAASSPAWSASTGLIAYLAAVRASDTGPGRTWPAVITASGQPVPMPEQPTLANGTVSWSADGRWLAGISAAGTNVSGIWVFPIDGRAAPRKMLTFSSEARPWGVTWSPDGRRLVYGLHERSADIVLFDSGETP
jgi:Tol biopolymer transport system component